MGPWALEAAGRQPTFGGWCVGVEPPYLLVKFGRLKGCPLRGFSTLVYLRRVQDSSSEGLDNFREAEPRPLNQQLDQPDHNCPATK